MTTSTLSTGFGESNFADSITVTAVYPASKQSACFGSDRKGYERLPIPKSVNLERCAILIATAGFWLIVTWAV